MPLPTTAQSHRLFEQSKQLIPGGVNSPVRAFNGVGGEPIFIHHADGPYIFDADGNRYIDYVGSWGPMIAGHNHPHVRAAVLQAVERGLSYGAPTESEVLLAKRITELMKNLEQVRFVNSGTEASMTALRLARGATGRSKILKFIGCYHGHTDALLIKAGSGNLTLGIPDSAGVPPAVTADTLTVHFNDITATEAIFEKYGHEIAAVIVEPITGNMNFVKPLPEFLPLLRCLCTEYGSVLIIDEVMTGFRVAKGGAQSIYNIEPDLTILGKIIGGGMPVGAIGGKKTIMEKLAPTGPVYQAGTLSGNPVAMSAGLAMMDVIDQPGFYENLNTHMESLLQGMQEIADHYEIPFTTQNAGSMFGFYFTENRVIQDLNDVKACNVERFKAFFHAMLQRGVYFAPSAFEAGFFSSMHTSEVITQTLKHFDAVLKTFT